MDLDMLTDDEWTTLVDGLLRSEYHLLLGAGASLSARGGDGRPLASAQGLAQEIVDDFRLTTNEEPIDLRQAYELVEGLVDGEGCGRAEYLKARFSGCKSTWHHSLLPIRWRRIWNLNIDDIIEQTYAQNPTVASQVAKSYNWASPYREPDRERGEVQIIHLHGYARELEWPEPKEPNIVFSIVEYLQASSSRHAWHRVFGDEFLQSPFIVVGAKLADEYDLAEFLRRGNQSQRFTGRPSIIVLQHITPIQQQQFRKWGLVPIEREAQAFFLHLVKKLREAEAEQAAAIPGRPIKALTMEARTFLQQFQSLRVQTKVLEPLRHDFYGGEDPLWADIIYNRDARFEIADKLLAADTVTSPTVTAKPRQVVNCIWGPPFTGKSTALLRIGQGLISAGFDVFRFRGEERLDINATFWWVERSPKCVLLFDGLADFSDDVGKLCQKCSLDNANLLIFAVERERRLVEVIGNIATGFLQAGEDHQMSVLSDVDIERLLDKLQEQRRLGKLTDLGHADQTRYFRREAKRQLFAGMAELERAKGFLTRAKDEYLEIRNELARAVYSVSCMSYAIGYPLPIGIACVATGMSSATLISELSAPGELSSVLQAEHKGLRPRHRVVASLVVHDALERSERYQLSIALAKALAPHITPNAISHNTIPYRIIRQLMDMRVIFDWVGRNLVSDWYGSIISQYDWNARFWEQRALAEARLNRFPKARSFAEEAVKIHRDPFTLNTLGTILLRMAVDYYEPGCATSHELLWAGIEQLRGSRELGAGRFPHPYTTFFTYVLRFAQDAFRDEPVDARLAKEWQYCMREAQNAQAFVQPRDFDLLEEWHYNWLSLAVPRRTEAQGEG